MNTRKYEDRSDCQTGAAGRLVSGTVSSAESMRCGLREVSSCDSSCLLSHSASGFATPAVGKVCKKSSRKISSGQMQRRQDVRHAGASAQICYAFCQLGQVWQNQGKS